MSSQWARQFILSNLSLTSASPFIQGSLLWWIGTPLSEPRLLNQCGTDTKTRHCPSKIRLCRHSEVGMLYLGVRRPLAVILCVLVAFFMEVSIVSLFLNFFLCWFTLVIVSLEFAPKNPDCFHDSGQIKVSQPLVPAFLGEEKNKGLSYLHDSF